MRKGILVIGLGNPLSGDDAYGHRVVKLLEAECPDLLDRCDLIDAHTDLLGHLDSFGRYERVVLVDALLDPQQRFGAWGEVVTLGPEELDSLPDPVAGIHEVSPLTAIKLYKTLKPDSGTRFSLVALCTDRIGIGAGNRLTQTAVEEGCSRICKMHQTSGSE